MSLTARRKAIQTELKAQLSAFMDIVNRHGLQDQFEWLEDELYDAIKDMTIFEEKDPWNFNLEGDRE